MPSPAGTRAAGELLPLVYAELRRLAARELAGERPGQTLQPTALVHEAYLRLVGTGPPLAGPRVTGRKKNRRAREARGGRTAHGGSELQDKGAVR
jgi:hypothetical protein